MSIRAVLFLVVFCVFLLALLVTGVTAAVRARRSAGHTWETLLARLIAIDRYKVALVAAGAVEIHRLQPQRPDEHPGKHPGKHPGEFDNQVELEPQEIWDLLGGMQGLEALGANCEVLIDLACYVQATYPEALLVAEQLRLNAREIQWHLSRLRASAEAEVLHASFPQYAQRTAATYYRMTQSLLTLYEAVDVPGHAQLLHAL